MAVTIRMRKSGRKNEPGFRVVATDVRFPRDGRSLELLGWYDPRKPEGDFQLDTERINYWIGKGAIVSDTVRSLLKKNKAAEKKKTA